MFRQGINFITFRNKNWTSDKVIPYVSISYFKPPNINFKRQAIFKSRICDPNQFNLKDKQIDNSLQFLISISESCSGNSKFSFLI